MWANAGTARPRSQHGGLRARTAQMPPADLSAEQVLFPAEGEHVRRTSLSTRTRTQLTAISGFAAAYSEQGRQFRFGHDCGSYAGQGGTRVIRLWPVPLPLAPLRLAAC